MGSGLRRRTWNVSPRVARILTTFLTLPLLLSPGFASEHHPADLLFVQIGAGLFGDTGFRTVFRLSNETGEAIEGTLILTATDGTALAAELAAAWTTPGHLQIEDNRADFSIPSESTLRLTVLPGEKATIGWARLTRSASLSVQALFQYAEGLATPDPIFNFEDHIIRQIENHPVIQGKSFVFPVSLYHGFQTLNHRVRRGQPLRRPHRGGTRPAPGEQGVGETDARRDLRRLL